MKCPLCRGEMKEGKTSLPYEVGEKLIVLRNVPALICEQCGEVFIKMEVAKEAERLLNTAIANGMLLGFVEYAKAA